MRYIRFFPNTKDNTRCYQAVLRMVLAAFFPDKTFSYKQLDKMTGKKKGLWTWPIPGIVSLYNQGFEIKIIENFDIAQFVKKGRDYLAEKYGQEVAAEQDSHSDIDGARRLAGKLLPHLKPELRVPALSDIKNLLLQGYLVVVNVNSKKLNRKTGYVGHFLLVHRMSSKSVVVHDPGLPPRENRRVSLRVFEEAWGYPNREAKNLVAYRLKRS